MEERKGLTEEQKWAYEHCPKIFKKYVEKRTEDQIDVASEIDQIFKELGHELEVYDYEDLLKDAKQSLPQEMFVSKAEFEDMLCDWVLQFKEEAASNIISECLDIIQERYNDSPQEIEYLLSSLSEDNTPIISVEMFPQFVKELMNILEVRIANFSAKNPKSEDAACDKEEENDFLTTIGEIARELNLKTIDLQTSQKILVNYFKGIQAKYCMVAANNENNSQPEADPEENDEDKYERGLLMKGIQKKSTEFDNIPQQRDSVDMKKDDFRVRNVEYGEDDDYQAQFNNPDYSESDQYYENRNNARQSIDKQDDKVKSQLKSNNKSKSPNRLSKADTMEIEKRLEIEPGETLEDKRNRGIKEIFEFYSRQHLMIGRKATFEQIEYELSNMNMGEFMKFCKDFYIPLSKVKCAEVFKKTAKNSKEMFLENFKAALPKLIAMRNKEEFENLEKRLKEVKKLILKRKKKLEIDDTPIDEVKPTNRKPEIHQRQVNIEEDDFNRRDQPTPPLSRNEDLSKNNSSKQISSSKLPTKSKGGDPHGAIQRMENEALEKIRKEKEEAMNSINIKNRENIQKSNSNNDLNDRQPVTENEQPEDEVLQEVKPEIKKVDEKTLRMRMEQDKEMKTLQEEKERISKLIEDHKRRSYHEDQLNEEALQLIQCDDPLKYKKKIVGFSSPFGVIDKNERIDKDDKSRKYKFKSKEDKAVIKAKVKEIKAQRENQKKKKELEREEQYIKHRNLMKNLHYKLMKDKDGGFKEGTIPAYQVKSEDQIYDVRNSHPALKLNQLSANKIPAPQTKRPPVVPPNKLTLESLGLLKYEDFVGGGSDGFNPADIVDENDHDSEDEILKRYKVNDRKPIEDQNMNIIKSTQIIDQPYNSKPTQLRQYTLTDREKESNPKKISHKAHNNSISNAEGLGIPKTLSKKDLITQPNSKSKQNLLVKPQDIKSPVKKRGPTSDDEKVYKNKLVDNRSRKVDLPKGAAKSGRKNKDAYRILKL